MEDAAGARPDQVHAQNEVFSILVIATQYLEHISQWHIPAAGAWPNEWLVRDQLGSSWVCRVQLFSWP